jgi:hypothetical protein
MRYRALDADGDYTFGQNGQNFLVNSAQAVRQAIQTTLLLFAGEWFLDLSQGVPWLTEVIGNGTAGLYDQVIQTAILGVEGVSGLNSYSSSLDPKTRALTVVGTAQSIYGSVTFNLTMPTSPFGFGISPFGLRPFGDPVPV